MPEVTKWYLAVTGTVTLALWIAVFAYGCPIWRRHAELERQHEALMKEHDRLMQQNAALWEERDRLLSH